MTNVFWCAIYKSTPLVGENDIKKEKSIDFQQKKGHLAKIRSYKEQRDISGPLRNKRDIRDALTILISDNFTLDSENL